MKYQQGIVAIKQLPHSFSNKQGHLFFSELESCMNTDRPLIVLDCSRLERINRNILILLLRCLQESMKRNGDVRLAAIPKEVKAALELTGAHRLFEIYETNTEAANSYGHIMVSAVS